MNPIMDFLTLVSFYCISLFMIPHSELIPNVMTITAGPHCRRRRRQEKESSIKTFFAMKRNVLQLDDGFGIIKSVSTQCNNQKTFIAWHHHPSLLLLLRLLQLLCDDIRDIYFLSFLWRKNSFLFEKWLQLYCFLLALM